MTSDNTNKRPFVGVGVIIVKDGRVLFGQRLHSHGIGDWSVPGGHLEYKETFEECAAREAAEETGLAIKNPRVVRVVNDYFKQEDKHYVTVYVQADWASGKPQVLEPDKMDKWAWFDWREPPKPLFLPTRTLINSGFQLDAPPRRLRK